MQVLRFHECPECGRLSPYLQSRCDCGYRFVGSEAQYKTCPECGSIIPSGQIVCDCGHVTLPKVRKSAPSSPAIPIPASRAPTAPKKRRDFTEKQRLQIFFGGSLAAAVLILLALVPVIFSSDDEPADFPDPPASSEVGSSESDNGGALVSLTPQLVRNGQIIEAPLSEGLAPLGVTTPTGKNCYVYLSSLEGSSYKNTGFYVEADQFAEVLVPLGLYEIYYATGDVWYGPDYLFGEDTRRYQCEGTFRFYDDGEYYQGWTLELYLQDNGNMDSDPIDASDWPA